MDGDEILGNSTRINAVRFLGEILEDPDWMDHASESFLLAVGGVLASTDYAVQHYADPWHPKFFGKRRQLLHAIRRESDWPRSRARLENLEWLAHKWTSSWRGNPDEKPLAERVRSGCDALREWFGSLTTEQATSIAIAAAGSLDMENGDQLLTDLGFTWQDNEDEVWEPIPLPNLPGRFAKAHPMLVCEFAEALRNLTNTAEPSAPRSDYIRVLDATKAWIGTRR